MFFIIFMYKEEKAKDLLMKALKVCDVLSWNPAGKLMENKDCVSFIFVPPAQSNS